MAYWNNSLDDDAICEMAIGSIPNLKDNCVVASDGMFFTLEFSVTTTTMAMSMQQTRLRLTRS